MNLQDEFLALCIEVVSSDLFQQIAPLLVLLLVPALILTVASKAERSSLFFSAAMILDHFGLSLPWNWSAGGSSTLVSSGRATQHDKKKLKKSHVRTRADQMAMNGSAKQDLETHDEDDGYYPGLVNISGTYCFMNSTLQALASLSYLKPHIDAIHAKAEALDVPTPVIDSLRDLFHDLNTPRSSYHSIRPLDIIDVLSNHGEGRTNKLLNSREHQDAQELFQLLSECIKNEIAGVDKEGYRDKGLGGLSQASETNREIGKSVFDGLTANRRSCVVCGYTEAVMHFAFDNWQLAVPRMAANVRLEECLEDYTRLEVLRDCICRKCSMLATHRRLQQEVASLEEATRPDAKPSRSKKQRLRDVRKMEARVKAALDEGRIEEDLKDIRMEKVFSTASTKQAMIARPPPILALHINRSVHYGQYASKNTIRLIFPEVLDLTPFTTSGNLSTIPTSAISTPPPNLPRSTTPTPATFATQRTIYRLSAVVCHYGQHSFGHYICYRRRPKNGGRTWNPPKLLDPLKVEDDGMGPFTPEYLWEDEERSRPGTGWLRISDDAVRECGIETVLQEGSGAFMLYYERAVQARPGIYPLRNSPKGSEETLKPESKTIDLNGSVGSLVSEVGVGVLVKTEEKPNVRMNGSVVGIGSGLGGSQTLGPRIVRSVAAGRGRSSSVTTSTRESSVISSTSPESSEAIPIPKWKSSPAPRPVMNGYANGHIQESMNEELSIPPTMSSSAPSILSTKPSVSSLTSTSSSSSSSTITPSSSRQQKKHPLPPRLHSPKPNHPPPGPSVVGLKA